MSGIEITRRFDAEYATRSGVGHALGCCNGTASLMGAMRACGVGAGDEIIRPSMTCWASIAPAPHPGATVNFADIDTVTRCIDPRDIEHRIGPRTQAIVIVHCAGHPAAKDAILPIPDRHGLKVIDDNSHAHGSLHKGRVTGAFGDVTGASMMAGKSFAIGKAGMLTKNTPKISECAIACGHYERTGGASRYALSVSEVHGPLEVLSGEPAGGFKHRVNQTCSAPGRVQLRHNPERVAEIQRAMKRFGELLDRLPGLRAHRPPKQSGSTMGGWSAARGLHKADELGGLPLEKFRVAARDQDLEQCAPEANFPLRTHALFHHGDIFGHEGPTAAAFGRRGVRQGPESPPVAQRIHAFCFSVLRLSYDWTEAIEAPAEAFRKVVLNASLLLGKSRHPEAFPENLPKVFKSSTVSAA